MQTGHGHLAMAKDYAVSFYNGKAWHAVRKEYARSVGGLCERCKERGKIVPGVIVHHIKHITQHNINDPEITLNPENLMLLCRDCHAEIHGAEPEKRFFYTPDGQLMAR